MQSEQLIKTELTEEQGTILRFCLENWDRIEYFKKKKLFDFRNGSITINYKPLGDIQSVHYYEVDNECEKSCPQFAVKIKKVYNMHTI